MNTTLLGVPQVPQSSKEGSSLCQLSGVRVLGAVSSKAGGSYGEKLRGFESRFCELQGSK